MASLVRKVFKGVTSKWDEGASSTKTSPAKAAHLPPPVSPPVPDISDLTADEISILQDVFRRQEEFERQENERLRRISSDIQSFEQTVQKHAGTKSRIKHVDLRLCRLCYKTRFADGIGRVCSDCSKRVCSKCGAFCHPKNNSTKKSVKATWRCRMCIMKRDALCRTGSWYHGDSLQDGSNDQVIEKLKTSVSMEMDTEIVSNARPGVASSEDEKLASGNKTDSEAYRTSEISRAVAESQIRRRSLPINHGVKERMDSDDSSCHWLHERRRSRKRRSLRNTRRRNSNQHGEDMYPVVSSDGSQDDNEQSGEAVSDSSRCRRNSSTRCHKRRPSRISIKEREQSLSDGSLHASSTDSTSGVSYATKESSVSDGACSPTLIHKIKRQNAVYCSSSSSVMSDSKQGDSQGDRASPHRDAASLSPIHVAKDRHAPNRPEILNRRVTLQTCQLMDHGSDPKLRRLGTLKTGHPHAIILHKDKTDTSQRTRGLGMRIVGGKECEDGMLGAFVVMVTKSGPADVQGRIRAGDQILEFNGISLLNVTFEETRDIINQSGDVVQLKVLHRHLKSRLPEQNAAKRIQRIVSADMTLGRNDMTSQPPDSLPTRPRRRMLPKTPIEMKKETRRITGRIFTRIYYIVSTERLEVTIMRAEQLSLPESSMQCIPNPFVLVYMLPDRRLTPGRETRALKGTRTPVWNKTFYFHNVSEEQLLQKAVEITVWSKEEKEDVFLGEVLLDLQLANLEYESVWFDLADHDENSSHLPLRKRAETISVDASSTAAISPKGTQSPGSSPQTAHRSLPITPNEQSTKSHFRRSPTMSVADVPQDRLNGSTLQLCNTATGTDRKSPRLTPPRSPSSGDRSLHSSKQDVHRNSFTSKVKRKMSSAVSKMSSSLSVADRRESAVLSDDTSPCEAGRSRSFGDDSRDTSPNRPRSRKASYKTANPDLLAPPRPLSRTNSQSSFYENESISDDDPYADFPVSPDRLPPEGDDITSRLGPGQVPPKPSAEHLVCGDIRLGFMVSKGQLEIDVIGARILREDSPPSNADTYAKTYLMEGKKVLQKKKTQVVKGGGDLVFKRMIKYSACNAHGRHMKINVWEKVKGFDKKKQCLGETVVRLDSLDLSQHTMGWYKMFSSNSTDFGSNESLINW